MVTGASRGMGAAIAERLARAGVDLALAARDAEKLMAVAERCREHGVRVVAFPVDLAEADAPRNLVDGAVTDLGGLNILVNNAGVFHPGPLDKLDPAGLDTTLDVNLRAVLHLIRWAVPYIINAAADGPGRGAVVNISSLSGRAGHAMALSYCATKFALTGVGESVFDELRGHGIKVSTIYPGFTATDMVDVFGRDKTMMIQPEDLAELVYMVASWPDTSCPTEIVLEPQRYPKRLEQ